MTDDNTTTVEIPEQTLGQYILTGAVEVARESHDTYEEHGMSVEWDADGVEWDWRDADIEAVDRDDTTEDEERYVVHARTEGTSSRQVSRAVRNAPPSKCSPAEYETVRHQVALTAEWYPERAFRTDEYRLEVVNQGRL